MLDRRFLLGGVGVLAVLAGLRWLQGGDVEASGSFEVQKTDGEWRNILTKAQYEVLRLHRTEIPGSSPLNHEEREGTYACVACDLPLFSSRTKFDSKTGWPNFFRRLPDAFGYSTDHALLLARTEGHCRRSCG